MSPRNPLGTVGQPSATSTKSNIPDPRQAGAAPGTGALAYLERYRLSLMALEEATMKMGGAVPILGIKARAERILQEIRDARVHADSAIADTLAALLAAEHAQEQQEEEPHAP